MVRMGEVGQLTGAKDKHGREIRIGDTLRFDYNEWNRTELCLSRMFGKEPREERLEECVFIMRYSDGALDHPGCYSDLSSWCEIIETFEGVPLPSQIEEERSSDEVDQHGDQPA